MGKGELKTDSIERYLRTMSETESMEIFFDFINSLNNVDAVREAYISKTEEIIKDYLNFFKEMQY